ncbi:MAG TPA: hypothetical protein PLY87_04660 [Planctomycetaceae bacterium]|nr:hypothetical protein [Planctomycetaceae bacterium]
MNSQQPSIDRLRDLFRHGTARVPASWGLTGPETTGLWWQAESGVVVASPLLLRMGQQLPRVEECPALLLATESRYRNDWLKLQAARIGKLGDGGRVEELCDQISTIGPAADLIRQHLSSARLEATAWSSMELEMFDAPADQSAAAPALLRVLGLTARLVEGQQGKPCDTLPEVHVKDPRTNWQSGRLLLAPGTEASVGGQWVLGGHFKRPQSVSRMSWVLSSPWVMMLGLLTFMAEAWAAERRGGVTLELPFNRVNEFATPSQIDIVVTLPEDDSEVLCGSLGEFCLRVLDALDMALVPSLVVRDLDAQLGHVVSRLLAEGVWSYQPQNRPRYLIGEEFSNDCYRSEGHKYIYRAADGLADVLREVCLSWARSRVERKETEAAV